MDIVTIIELLAAVFLGEGFLTLIKWFYTRKDEKKSATLDNEKKQYDIQLSTIDEWEKLTAQHEKDIMYYRESITEKDAKIRELNDKIGTLKDQVNYLTSSVTQAQMLRCDCINCDKRIPPFGYKKINFSTGELELDS